MTFVLIVVAVLITWWFTKRKYYWQGRMDGCKAIETMVMDRAGRKGYDPEKVWADLLQ
jgi:hypothetical protein